MISLSSIALDSYIIETNGNMRKERVVRAEYCLAIYHFLHTHLSPQAGLPSLFRFM